MFPKKNNMKFGKMSVQVLESSIQLFFYAKIKACQKFTLFSWLVSQQCFSLTLNQHQSSARQQYFSFTTNQHQLTATSCRTEQLNLGSNYSFMQNKGGKKLIARYSNFGSIILLVGCRLEVFKPQK